MVMVSKDLLKPVTADNTEDPYVSDYNSGNSSCNSQSEPETMEEEEETDTTMF